MNADILLEACEICNTRFIQAKIDFQMIQRNKGWVMKPIAPVILLFVNKTVFSLNTLMIWGFCYFCVGTNAMES